MTKQEILQALDDILAVPYDHPDENRRQDIEELRDEIHRDLILFPEVHT